MKKIVILECLLLLYTTVNHFLDCDVQRKVDFIWQPETTSSSVIRRNSKALPKAKLAPKKSWSLSGGLLLVWSPLQLFEPQWNHYIWEVCSANRWDALKTAMPAAGTGQQNAGHTTNGSKTGWIGLRNFVSSAIFTWPLANQLLLLQVISTTFLQGKHFHNQKAAENVCRILKHGFACYRNKETYFSLAKMWL